MAGIFRNEPAATKPVREVPPPATDATGLGGNAPDVPLVPAEADETTQSGVSGRDDSGVDLRCSCGERCGPVRWKISDESGVRWSCDGHLLENVLWFERATIEAVGTKSGRALARAARAVLAGEGLK